MKDDNENKGLLGRPAGGKKAKKSSCCCNFEIEEIPEENTDNKSEGTSKDEKGGSCCK